MIHSYVVNNVGHKLKLLAALLSIWENPLAGNVDLNITDLFQITQKYVTFCAELLENGGNRLLMAELTEPICDG